MKANAVLMHKDVEVAAIEYESGTITGINQILNEKHMPPGTYKKYMPLQMAKLYLRAWQQTRAIPCDRLNLERVLTVAGKTVPQLCGLAHGMGLTDQYWIRGTEENICWEDINFHKNGFQPSILTLSGSGKATVSPDYETNGSLPKSWILLENTPVLLKGSPSWLPTASANEVVASRIAELLNLDHALYFPLEINGKVVCASSCFVDEDREEFVSLQLYGRTNRGTAADVSLKMGLNPVFLNSMTGFDLMIGNTDRHEGNFGIMVDPDTMEYLRPAPLFDSGTSLHHAFWNDGTFKPFSQTTEEAWKTLTTRPFSVPDSDTLARIITNVYIEFGVQEYAQQAIDEICENSERLANIAYQREKRIRWENEPCL